MNNELHTRRFGSPSIPHTRTHTRARGKIDVVGRCTSHSFRPPSTIDSSSSRGKVYVHRLVEADSTLFAVAPAELSSRGSSRENSRENSKKNRRHLEKSIIPLTVIELSHSGHGEKSVACYKLHGILHKNIFRSFRFRYQIAPQLSKGN